MKVMWSEVGLKEELSSLPPGHRVAFAAACCERLIPNYFAFHQMEDWGQPAFLRSTLDQIWFGLMGKATLGAAQLSELKQSCMAIVPDTEDFSSLFVSAAGDAVASIIYTLDCYLTGDIERASLVGRLTIETLYQYLHIVNYPDVGYHTSDSSVEEWLGQAPLISAEEAKQQEDIKLLKSYHVLNEKLLEDFRRSSAASGIQPFARGLIKNRT
jgi:uncharacterized protein